MGKEFILWKLLEIPADFRPPLPPPFFFVDIDLVIFFSFLLLASYKRCSK